MEKFAHQIADWLLTVLIAACPAMLGATVAMLYEKGLTWSDRFVRLAVGVVVNFFVSNVLLAIWPALAPAAVQAISFVFGLIAFRAVPPFITASADRLAELPGVVLDRILPRKVK